MRYRAALLAAVLLVSRTVPGTPAVPAPTPAPQASPAPDAGLTAGINLVRDGDFDGAILLLDAAARRLQPDRTRQKDAARAYVYLGVAYLELDQELVARGKFEAALALDPQMRLDPREFSPQQIRVFEGARPAGTAATSPGPVPAPSPSPGDKKMVAAVPPEKKKKSIVPWLLVGGAVLGGGAALAGGGGGGGGTNNTTLSTVGNVTSSTNGTTTTTSSTVPPTTDPNAPTTTTSSTTTTSTLTPSTTLGPTTTTTGTTTTIGTTTTTTPPTTTPPSCSYILTPDTQQVPRTGGSGTCQVDTNLQSCQWTLESSDTSWLRISPPSSGSGSGDGSAGFRADPNLQNGARSARIRLQSDPGTSCTVTQPGLLGVVENAGAATFISTLDLEGGEGQVVVDGSTATFQRRGAREAALPEGRALHRVEATVVDAAGRAGTWRFALASGVAPGTLRIVAGNGALAGDAGVVFRLSGKPGERVVFTFRGN